MVDRGWAPAELSVCVRNVGIVERAELGAVPIEAGERVLDAVSTRFTDGPLAVGGVAQAAGAWWCRPRVDRLLVIGSHDARVRVADVLRSGMRRHPGVAIGATDNDLEVIGLIGTRTPALLGALGVDVAGAPCQPDPSSPGVWLLESDVGALCCVASQHLIALRERIAQTGRPYGLGHVGAEALALYALLQRGRNSAPGRPPV